MMRPLAAVVVSAALCAPAFAAPWSFHPAIDVTAARGERVFHHLDAAGRKSVAAGEASVAVVWEDNRDGTPRCYLALKALSAPAFAPELRLSGDGECYEPAVTALADNRYVAVWEESGRTRARLIDAGRPGPVVTLGEQESAQASVGASGDIVHAAWVERDGRFMVVRTARLTVDKDTLRVTMRSRPDPTTPDDDQQYPSIAPAASGAVAVAWEDRRKGHTLILHAHSSNGERYDAPRQINELPPPEVSTARNLNLGRGSGAMRVALARQDAQRLIVVWLDKRDFLSGYDVYAARSSDGGRSFGKNEKVQDDFGNAIAQWHPAVSANAEHIAVAWDDDRDETADIWLSWPEGTASWSGDITPGNAGGDGHQSDPALALHPNGDLSLVWLDKDDVSGQTRLRYLFGRRLSE